MADINPLVPTMQQAAEAFAAGTPEQRTQTLTTFVVMMVQAAKVRGRDPVAPDVVDRSFVRAAVRVFAGAL